MAAEIGLQTDRVEPVENVAAHEGRTQMLIRGLLNVGIMGAAIIGFVSSAQSQTTARYPSAPIKLIVPYAPGGLVDTLARQLGNAVSPALGQPIIVENRPGAGGRIAAGVVAHAAPDGQTLLFTTLATLTLNPLMPPKPDFDVRRDFKPVTAVAKQPLFVAARELAASQRFA